MASLRQRIAQSVVNHFLPPALDRPRTLELAAGAGQLRDWLREEDRATLVHLDRDAHYLRELHRQHHTAAAVRADAQGLPLRAQSCDAALAVCALDVLADPLVALRELERVMRPGAVFVHFFDLLTNLGPVLAERAARHEVVLPNFLAGRVSVAPALRERLTPATDFLAIPQREYARWVAWLSDAGHPLASTLATWGHAFLPTRFDEAAAVRLVVKELGSSERRHALTTLWWQIYTASRENGDRWLTLEPLSSLEHTRSRLAPLFDRAGFEVLFDDVVVASESVTPDAAVPAGARVQRDWAGLAVWLPEAEPLAQGVPVDALAQPTPASASRPVPAPDTCLFTCGVHVFVARRRHDQGNTRS